jgi:hypothetical protein
MERHGGTFTHILLGMLADFVAMTLPPQSPAPVPIRIASHRANSLAALKQRELHSQTERRFSVWPTPKPRSRLKPPLRSASRRP